MRSQRRRSAPTKKPAGRWRRRWIILLAGGPIAILALWIAVNKITWLGPIVADTLRAIIGTEAVARLEDFAYGVQDEVYQAWRGDEAPKAYWEVPAEPELAPPPVVVEPADVKPKLPPFVPEAVGPVHDSWSAPGDGQWLAMKDVDHPERVPYMFKTLLHPDKKRSWAELFVVAIDLKRTRIHLVPGSREPKATVEAAMNMARPGTIAEDHREQVLAAFNGGFKTEHGTYGMQVDELTIVEPREGVCAVAQYKDETIEVATWERIAPRRADMLWWRQTPNCMWEDGKMHSRLLGGFDLKWGATLDGETVIRRSAIGVTEDGRGLLVGISNHTTAPAIALGMQHAGAVTVAQLDVNFSYPKFVTFEKSPEEERRIAIALASGFEFSEDEFIRKKSYRDFFYVMPKDLEQATAQN